MSNRMAIKTIAVPIPTIEGAGRLMQVVLPLAAASQATVVGVHITPPVTIYGDTTASIIRYISEQRNHFHVRARRIGADFRAATEAAGVANAWHEAACEAGEVLGRRLVQRCRVADLIVTCQHNETNLPGGDDPADLVLETGRPVLIVPNAGRLREVGLRVLIAWDGGRESTRAAFDALPLLGPSANIMILRHGSSSSTDQDHALVSAIERHGHTVEQCISESAQTDVAERILAGLEAYSADLLVMGCYGHSRMRETVFGGVTKSILREMPVPVLMSH
jgi:nucleotide-binding universal stress UspA family protein